jgi:spore coat polysaccharide biosynthesis predicted glycosyltransferase SpsG
MKIIFYCQYVWGMGHLFRSLELVRALAGHDVVLIAGGRKVDEDRIIVLNFRDHSELYEEIMRDSREEMYEDPSNYLLYWIRVIWEASE